MTTPYFLLVVNPTKNICDTAENQVITLNQKTVHILPYVNVDYYMKRGLFESNIIDWCKQLCRKDKIMLDIGAHSGTYALSLADYSSTVYAFEPQKATYYSLCGGVCLSGKQNITCYQVGLGSHDQCGIKELNIVSPDGGGSTLHPKSPVLRTENIEIRTLDSYNIDNIGFIKIDVEENELHVLHGGIETLIRSNFPKILFESNYENKSLFDFLRNIGYKIIPLNEYRNMYLAEH
jgi:FkbM family methyltransferase